MTKTDKDNLIFAGVVIIIFGIPLLAVIYGIGTKHWYHEVRKPIPEDCGQYSVIAYEEKRVPKRCVEEGE